MGYEGLRKRDLEVFWLLKDVWLNIVEWLVGSFMRKKSSREGLLWREGYRS